MNRRTNFEEPLDEKNVMEQFSWFIRKMTDAQRAVLPEILWEYFLESDHNGWDGYERRDFPAIRRLLYDMYLCITLSDRWPAGTKDVPLHRRCCWED